MNPIAAGVSVDTPLLATECLTKDYPGGRALDGVSLTFSAGGIGAVIGRNGAGKSTLVGILSGAIRPSGGSVLLAGRPVKMLAPADAIARGIATVYQELSLIPGLSVGENILLGRLPRRRGALAAAINWRALFAQADAILQALQVRLDVRAQVSRLSLAQQQMVEIARAMSFAPRVVLLDEPTSGLARAEVETLFRLMRTLAGRGVAIVYITHRLDELARIADTVTALRDGRHVATIPGAEATPAAIVALMFGESPRPSAPAGEAARAPADHEARAAVSREVGFPEDGGDGSVEELDDGASVGQETRSPTEHAAGPAVSREARFRGNGVAAWAASPGSARGAGPSGADHGVPNLRLSPRPAPAGPPLLEVRGLTLEGILHDVHFTLHRGEILGIAGMLGSGRTELLLCLFGALRAERGEIWIEEDRRVPALATASAWSSPAGAARSSLERASRAGRDPLRHDADYAGGDSVHTPERSGLAHMAQAERAPGSRQAATARPVPGPSDHGTRVDIRGRPPSPGLPEAPARTGIIQASQASPREMKRRGLALIPENRKAHGLVTCLSTLDNACLASLRRVARRGVLGKRRQRAAVEPLVRALAIGVCDLEDPVSALSGGNQQKVVIAKWLSNNPRVMLFDEPTRGIDVVAKEQVFALVKRLSMEGVAAIVVSSELEELPGLCHRILVMRQGRIAAEVAPDAGLERLFSLCMEG